jgi:hypothetical protein
MKITYALVISVFILTLIGYGERCEANDINAFVKACLSYLELEEPMCKCLAKKADEDLTPTGFAYLVALMNKDEAKAKKLLSQLNFAEKLDANMFLVNRPQKCAEELGGN